MLFLKKTNSVLYSALAMQFNFSFHLEEENPREYNAMNDLNKELTNKTINQPARSESIINKYQSSIVSQPWLKARATL